MLKPLLALLLSVVFASACHAKDYLTRGNVIYDQSLPSFKRYDREIKRVLSRAWQKDVVVRALHEPPFSSEWIVGVIHSPAGYRAFRLEASFQIWEAINDHKEELSKVHGLYADRLISEATASRIASLWRFVLADHANYGKDPTVYGDSSTFHFFVGFSGGENLSAYTTYLFDGAKVEELVNASNAIYDYVSQKPESAAKLDRSIRKAEKRFHLGDYHATHLTRR
jgi:hypothetical protein